MDPYIAGSLVLKLQSSVKHTLWLMHFQVHLLW